MNSINSSPSVDSGGSAGCPLVVLVEPLGTDGMNQYGGEGYAIDSGVRV